MSKGAIVLLVVGVAAAGVGVALFVGRRSTPKPKPSSSGPSISSSDVLSFLKGAVPVVQGVVEYFND
jgi:hypothetical protein